MKPEPTFERERALWKSGYGTVAGVDEVGRGPLAGPVVAAAVVFPAGTRPLEGLTDSKLLTRNQRLKLVESVKQQSVFWSVAAASVKEIDRFNIRVATIRAIRRAILRLGEKPQFVLVDGSEIPELEIRHECLVKGDSRCQSIAAASVLAKVTRDHLMEKLARRYPGYGWDSNKGYGTAEHLAALNAAGPTYHHRKTFTPVVQLPLFHGE